MFLSSYSKIAANDSSSYYKTNKSQKRRPADGEKLQLHRRENSGSANKLAWRQIESGRPSRKTRDRRKHCIQMGNRNIQANCRRLGQACTALQSFNHGFLS